jgi:tetratricopeptide (TPR) repeat protein
MRATRLLPLAVLVALGCGRGAAKDVTPDTTPRTASGPAGSMPASTVGSAAWYVELGKLHERFHDLQGALAHFDRGYGLGTGPERIDALEGQARVREALGDKAGAVAALEEALALLARPRDRGAPPPLSMSGPQLSERLLGLYLAIKEHAKAEALARRLLGQAGLMGYQRDQLLGRLVEIHRAAGTLAAEVKVAEAALARGTASEQALRYLVAAYGGGGPLMPGGPGPGPAGAGGPGGAKPRPGPDLARLVPVYEALLAKIGGDPDLERRLVDLYERAGQLEKATALLRSVAERAACGTALPSLPPPSGALNAEQEVAILHLRSKRADEALAIAAHLLEQGTRQRDALHCVVAARTFSSAGDRGRAERGFMAAYAAARDRTEYLGVASAHLQWLEMSNREQLKPLLESWLKSTDACLKADAGRRLEQLARAAVPASMPGPRAPASGPASGPAPYPPGVKPPAGAAPGAAAAPGAPTPPTPPREPGEEPGALYPPGVKVPKGTTPGLAPGEKAPLYPKGVAPSPNAKAPLAPPPAPPAPPAAPPANQTP